MTIAHNHTAQVIHSILDNFCAWNKKSYVFFSGAAALSIGLEHFCIFCCCSLFYWFVSVTAWFFQSMENIMGRKQKMWDINTVKPRQMNTLRTGAFYSLVKVKIAPSIMRDRKNYSFDEVIHLSNIHLLRFYTSTVGLELRNCWH